MMTLRTLFEKQVFIRLSDEQTAFVCTTKWPLLSIRRRVGVGDAGPCVAPRITQLCAVQSQTKMCK
jgi:hypothetical protein